VHWGLHPPALLLAQFAAPVKTMGEFVRSNPTLGLTEGFVALQIKEEPLPLGSVQE